MKLIFAVETLEHGQRVQRFSKPIEIGDGDQLRSVSLRSEEGVIAHVPLAMWEGGPTWPPATLEEWSEICESYRRRVVAMFGPELDT